MKFAKVLQSELVPEWRKQYIDYKGLKRLLTSVKRSQEQERCGRNDSVTMDSTNVSITIPQPTEKHDSNLSTKPGNLMSIFKNLSNTLQRRKTSYDSPRSKLRKIFKKSIV